MSQKVKSKLTVKQEKFCINYFESGNAAAAATLAGYSVKSIRSIASEILTNPNIQSRISELQKKAEDASVMSVLERKQRLTEIARADLSDFVDESGDVTYSKDHANHKAVSEYNISTTYTKKGDPVVSKSIKLQNPITAIAELNKMDHVYDINNIQINNTQVVFVIGKGYQGRDPEPVEIEGSKDDLTPTNS